MVILAVKNLSCNWKVILGDFLLNWGTRSLKLLLNSIRLTFCHRISSFCQLSCQTCASIDLTAIIRYCFHFHQIFDFLLILGTVVVLRSSSSECLWVAWWYLIAINAIKSKITATMSKSNVWVKIAENGNFWEKLLLHNTKLLTFCWMVELNFFASRLTILNCVPKYCDREIQDGTQNDFLTT